MGNITTVKKYKPKEVNLKKLEQYLKIIKKTKK